MRYDAANMVPSRTSLLSNRWTLCFVSSVSHMDLALLRLPFTAVRIGCTFFSHVAAPAVLCRPLASGASHTRQSHPSLNVNSDIIEGLNALSSQAGLDFICAT